MNKPSKTLLITDLCLFAFAVGFFFVCSVLKNLFPVTASPINICLSAVCALAVILLMLFQLLCQSRFMVFITCLYSPLSVRKGFRTAFVDYLFLHYFHVLR